MWIRRHHDLQCRELVTVLSNLPKKSSQNELIHIIITIYYLIVYHVAGFTPPNKDARHWGSEFHFQRYPLDIPMLLHPLCHISSMVCLKELACWTGHVKKI
jgi:hypothetical protein